MSYKAVIIDDEPLACDLITEYLAEFTQIKLVGTAHNGFDGLKLIQEKTPHLLFLDVQMPRLTGFEMLELLNPAPAVIFTTAFNEFAVKAFEQSALDYLLKPIDPDRFKAAVNKFLTNPNPGQSVAKMAASNAAILGSMPQRLVIKDGTKVRLIPYPQLIRLKADGDYVEIHTAQGKFIKKESLTSLSKQLPAAQFARVHRSHVINLQHLEGVFPYGKNDHQAKLNTGDYIPVSRSGYQDLKKLLQL